MKKILIFIAFIFVSASLKAQNPYTAKMDSVFEFVDKSSITTGLLADYALPLADLKRYQGGYADMADSNMMTMDIWRSIYAMLQTADFDKTQPIEPLSQINHRVDSLMTGDTIPLVLMMMNYHRLRDGTFSDAFTDGLIDTLGGRFYDVPGTYSPFERKDAIAGTPAVNFSLNGNVSFRYDSTLFKLYRPDYADPSANLSLSVNFDDGNGSVALVHDSVYHISYDSAGYKRIRFLITEAIPIPGVSIHKHYFSRAWFYVAEAAPHPGTRYRANDPDNVFQVTAIESVPGTPPATATVSIRFSDFPEPTHTFTPGDTQLDKPLIVLEGYDFGTLLPAFRDPFDYEQFVNQIDRDAQNLPSTGLNFNRSLDDLSGYDLVFVSFDDPGVDLRNNAFVVQEIIRRVNALKPATGAEQNVVLGISMGGLIGRYALADMFQDGEVHDTRLLITHDSPHRGANVPLGFQAAVTHLNGVGFTLFDLMLHDIEPDIEDAFITLNRQASRQMLINPWLNEAPFMENGYRTMVDGGIGCQMIATSNGSECGLPQNLAPGGELVRFNLSAGTVLSAAGGTLGPVAVIIVEKLLHRALAASSLRLNPAALFMPLLTPFSRSDWEFDFGVHALENGNAVDVYRNKLISQKRVLGLIPIRAKLFEVKTTSSPGSFSWDTAAGGNIRLAGNAVAVREENRNTLLYDFSMAVAVADEFCFVPMVSALDVNGAITNDMLTQAFPATLSPNPTPFAEYIPAPLADIAGGEPVNQRHTLFTNRNADWMLNHMEGTPLPTDNCMALCVMPEIIGGPVCDTGSAFEVLNVGPTAEVNWRFGGVPAGTLTFSPNPAISTTITSVSGFQGWVTIQAEINQPECGIAGMVIERDVWIGVPEKVLIPGTGFTMCEHTITGTAGMPQTYTAFPADGASGYMWVSDDPDLIFDNGGLSMNTTTTIPEVDLISYRAGVYTIQVIAFNDCGFSSRSTTIDIRVINCSLGTIPFRAYPNPASTNLQVRRIDSDGNLLPSGTPFSVTMYDTNMQFQMQSNSDPNGVEASFYVGDLHNGIYILEIQDGANVWQLRVLVQH